MPGGQQRLIAELDTQGGNHFKEMISHLKQRIEEMKLDDGRLALFQSVKIASSEMARLLIAMATSDKDDRDSIGKTYTYLDIPDSTKYFKFPSSIILPDGRKINILIKIADLSNPKDFWDLYFREADGES